MLLLNRKTFDSMILVANFSWEHFLTIQKKIKNNAVLDILERYMIGQVFRLGDT